MGLWNDILETVGWKAPDPQLSNEVYSNCFDFNRITPGERHTMGNRQVPTPVDFKTLPLEMQKILGRTIDDALSKKQKASLADGSTQEELDAIRGVFSKETAHFITNPDTKEFEQFRITVKEQAAPEKEEKREHRAPKTIELGDLNLPTNERFPSAEATTDNKMPAANSAKTGRQVG